MRCSLFMILIKTKISVHAAHRRTSCWDCRRQSRRLLSSGNKFVSFKLLIKTLLCYNELFWLASRGALALLPRLAFDGATKRNLPELRRGDVVFCKVTSAFKDCDTEVFSYLYYLQSSFDTLITAKIAF